VLDVAGRLGEPAPEVLEPVRLDPGVVDRPGVEAGAVDRRREQLGERGADRLLPGPLAREVDVSVDGEAAAGEDALLGDELVALEPDRPLRSPAGP
jgi:hypothetical protein